MREHGSVYEVDAERLAELRPDLILTQAVCEVCAVPTASAQEAAASLDYKPTILSLDAHDLAGIFCSIMELGRAAGVEARAQAYVASLRQRIEAVRQRVAGRSRPRILALEWLDPPFVPGHWVPEMVELAGGRNVLGNPGQRSYEVSWSDLAGSEPDLLVVMPCGFGLEASRADACRYAERLHAIASKATEWNASTWWTRRHISTDPAPGSWMGSRSSQRSFTPSPSPTFPSSPALHAGLRPRALAPGDGL